MDRKDISVGYQRPNSEETEINAELFYVIHKRNISAQKKMDKIKKLLGRKPQSDINAQDSNDNLNTALHMAIKRNELEVVNFLLSQGADTTTKNGDGKTPLQLAEECNHMEIIDALKSCNSQVEWQPSKTDRLASYIPQPVFHSVSNAAATGQQAASTVLPPFSGELRVDKELKLSNNDFKQSIEGFYENKKLSAIDQLKATSLYPTPHVMVQFASMAYCDFKLGDPTPPEGWKLLTTASNFGIRNGYFGTAYWHPEHQQLVIAHRGTDIKNFGALVTDIKGVLRNNYVQQMSSASTFAHKVVSVMQEIEKEKKVSFELFFTGHSLGGWLAQITNFTTEYLEQKGGIFLKKLKREEHEPLASKCVKENPDVKQIYHPHTVVFDSPGCKDMLSQMAGKLDVRLHGSSMDLQQLDITSYLSAPNDINTCNSHVGTVYRIFPDLSDMGFFEKHTPLYNLATHKMDKIVQAFDSETGQVRKDDKGRLNIREVVDWPVRAGLKCGPELNDFFKWAEHPNNYHSEVIDSEVPKGHRLLRYQTKAYDEYTKSLSIFTQHEREFLELYRWLCHLPEFFKPEDLFCVMNNAEVEREAQQNLRNFEIDNESVRCPDTRILNALIPYVKRLVRHFPQIKENMKARLSSPQIRNRVYQHETQRYVENIDQNALDFKSEALGLKEFLTSGQQIWQLRMVDGDVWTGITKVYRALRRTSFKTNYSKEGQYTILKLKRLLQVNRMINLKTLLASMETHLMVISCGTNQPVHDELRDMFKDLFNILKQKKNMKIILITQSDDSMAAYLEHIARETLDEGFMTTDEHLTWSDLTASSQTTILEKTVIFQGRRLALNQLTSAESMTDSFPISDLLKEKELRIGEDPVPSAGSGYNEKYYIDRTFNHNVVIRQDILSDKREGKFADLLASTEQEFKQLCQQFPKKNVHWLEKEKSGTLIWQQSQGQLKALLPYIDAHKSKTYAPSDLDNLLQQAKDHRVMIIADKAGMGKTTVLTHLSKRIKEKSPSHWLVRIDLNDYTEFFEAQKGKMIDKVGVLEFVSKEVLKLESHLQKELFKKIFEGNEISKAVIMVDGFDEISPTYKNTILDMLQVLKQTSLEQLWVTTRPHLREELEDNLQQLSYTLQPFSKIEQVELLKKFWFQTPNLEDKDQHRLQIYATALIRKLVQSIGDLDKEFTGFPIQTRMIAEAFVGDFRSFYLSEKSEPELPHKLDLLGLYRRLIDRKYNIHYREKSKIPASNMAAEDLRERDFKCIQLQHQLLALEALFTEDQVAFLQIDNPSRFSDEELARIGIAHKNNEGKPHFIHRTVAEYFVAEFLINQLTKETKQHEQVKELLLNEVLLKMDCRVIRVFLEGLLEKCRPSKEVLKEYGEKLDEQWNERKVQGNLTVDTSALHEAAKEDNAHIIGFLFDSLKSAESLTTITKMLLAQDSVGQNAWHLAALNDSVQALERIWKWAEVVTSTLTYSLLPSPDKDSKTASQTAAEKGHTKVVEKLWGWAKKAQINPGELQKKLLLGQNWEGRTAWHVAAQSGSVELIDKLWGWAKELSSPDLLKNKLLLSRDKNGINAWHLAAMTGSVEILGKLWDWAKDLQLEPTEIRKVLLSKDKFEQTAWHKAAGNGHVEVLEKLWEWAEEVELNPDCLKSVLYLPEQRCRYTAWCQALMNGRIDVIQKLWSWAKELQLTPDELKNKLFLDVDRRGNTAISCPLFSGEVEILGTLWGLSKKMHLNPDELSKLLVGAWHTAAEEGFREILEIMWLLAGEVQLNQQEVQRRLFLDQNKNGKNVWHVAVVGGHIEILEKLWGWAKGVQINQGKVNDEFFLDEHRLAVKGPNVEISDNLLRSSEKAHINSDDIRSIMFLAQYKCGKTAWHLAVKTRRIMVLEKLLDWAKEMRLNPDEIRNKLLLDKKKDGRAAWFMAAQSGNVKVLEELWVLAKEKGILKETKSKLLLAQNEYGGTALHMAAGGSVAVLEKLWAFAKEAQLNVDELQSKLLLAKDKCGNIAWHYAVAFGRTELLEILWRWAKEAELNTDKLFLAQARDGLTTLHLAALGNHVGILEQLWVWVEEVQMNANDLRKKLLLAKDNYGYTVWHHAAKAGSSKTLDLLCIWAKEAELYTHELLPAQNKSGETALHMAANRNHVEILHKLWVWVEEDQQNPNELEKKLLLTKDKKGYIAWHCAARFGNLKALETLWNWAKKVELNPDELLLAQNEEGVTAFQLAAKGSYEEILHKMWGWAKEAQLNTQELKNKLLQTKHKYGNITWHRAARFDSLEAFLRRLESESKPHELLPAQNEEGETALNATAK